VQPIRAAAQRQFHLEAATVVQVISLDKNGPAAKGGMQEGDILLTLDGKPVGTVDDVHKLLTAIPAGSHIKLSILRDNQRRELDVVVGEL
jgi:serine protease Do